MSSKGQIAIPKQVREALNLTEGSKLTLEVRGQEIVLSKGAAWRKLKAGGWWPRFAPLFWALTWVNPSGRK